MDRTTCAGFSIGLVAGALIGGAIALLYAPKSGKDTQEMLKRKAMETREAALDLADAARDFATETADKVIKAAAEANRKGEAVVRAIKT